MSAFDAAMMSSPLVVGTFADDLSAAPLAAASPEVFQKLGEITRQLHDTLMELGVMPKLQRAAEGLPDARSRLGYIATKTGEAAERVLDLVDRAQADRSAISDATRRLTISASHAADAGVSVEQLALTAQEVAADISAAGERIDAHLIDIMMAQDFHDLTSQVVAKVLQLAGDLEDSLVKLLVQAAPTEKTQKIDTSALNGPVVNGDGRTDVVANQGEVDDLLASLGF
ncbi:protein phosphatase CheZ [soil metagenome]